MVTIYDFYAGRSSYATPVCYIMIVSYRCDIVATILGVFRYGEAVELHSQIHLITQSLSQLLGRPHKGFPLLAFALGVGSGVEATGWRSHISEHIVQRLFFLPSMDACDDSARHIRCVL